MIVLIVSDSHGYARNVAEAIEITTEKYGKIDMLIHCGDLCGDEDCISQFTPATLHLVAGNCDGFCGLNRDDLFSIEGKKVFLTHGDGYMVSTGLEAIKSRAKQLKAEIILFGHTHRPLIVEEDGMIIINPGSLTYPRQEGRKSTFVVLTVDENKNFQFSIDYLS